MATVDQAAAKAALAFIELVEVNARCVLIETRGDLVLGFLDRNAVDVIDLLADMIIAKRYGLPARILS